MADKPLTLAFYMKSGNVVRARNITDWKIQYNEEVITKVTLTWTEHPGLIVETLCLSQIEAIVREPQDY